MSVTLPSTQPELQFRAQAEDDGVEVGQQAVGEAAQSVVHVGAGGGDPLGQSTRAADGHHRGEGLDVAGLRRA